MERKKIGRKKRDEGRGVIGVRLVRLFSQHLRREKKSQTRYKNNNEYIKINTLSSLNHLMIDVFKPSFSVAS